MEDQQKRVQQGEPELTALARRKESSVRGIDLMRVVQCDETQVPSLSGAPSAARVVADAPPVKRKRGRPPRAQAQPPPPQNRQLLPTPPPPRKEDKEEDVCFICFDGGDLVLCDRRNCPKAYHPSCVKREPSFFRTKDKWNCGWHICSLCEKYSSSFMCYTCTFSVCKQCIKDADYVIVRGGNMGLCGTCTKPIMLIENVAQGDTEAVKVDFDDKGSWEYLFKVYWVCLKESLSLTVDELTRANNPWKEASSTAPRVESQNDHTDNRAYSSGNSTQVVAVNGTKRRRTSDSPTLPNKLDAKNPSNIMKKRPGDANWATKELLEFVSLMRDGDTSFLSQFDVQGLLLEYIRKNNLRDPLQKSQVLCDPMLVKLFEKQRVGHFEMLKLLESHFLIQENPKDKKAINGETTHAAPAPSQIEEDSVHDPTGRDRRRKTRRKTDDSVKNANLDAYAAIDVHNINLIYLRRKFLETLLDDINKVHEKVVGTILRIKVSGSDQKLDIHRLVQVVGTCKATTSYQLGAKTTDVMLEILNLDKREVISIDQISDQNVTEDECKRLRQSIKCGLNKRLTVGDILKTATTLQVMRVNEALEAEILKLNHLRDRASEKGHRKELREFVEKLELLKSTEEHQRLLQEVPEVHTDPSMDPSQASSEDAGLGTRKQDNHITAKSKGPQKKRDALNNLGNNVQKKSGAPILRSRNVGYADKDDSSKAPSNSSDSQETGKDDEDNELWNYQDPTGKIQGPFSMVQLRRWKSSGHFPPYLKIWKAHENQGESVLLIDALAGRFDKATTMPSSSSRPQEPKLTPHDSGRTGVDVNGLQKNPTPVNTSATSSPSSTVVVLANDPKEKQVEALVKVENSISVRLQPQVSCPASISVVPALVVTPDVTETPGTDQSNAVQADGNHSTIINTVEDGTNAGSVSSINGSVNAPNLNQEINFPSPTPKSSPEDLDAEAAETIQSLSSCVVVKLPSGVTWSTPITSTTDAPTTTSSVVATGGQLPQVTQQNALALAAPSVKPIDLAVDHTTTVQTSENTQVAHSSGWPAIVADPDECDESVSDLLAEVEAMEQNGLPSSPTSTFHCDDDDDLTKGPEKDFFNPVARMSLTPETTCRMDVSQVSILHNVSAGKSSMGTEAKHNTPFSHCGTAGTELLLNAVPAAAPTSRSHDLTLTTTALRLGSETSVEGGSVERHPKSVSGLGLEPSPRSASSHDSARGNTERSPRGSQQKRTSGHGRDRQWWNNGHNSSFNNNSHSNRQWPYSSGHGYDHGSGSYAAHPPKGLKICKFYESGYCKRGASCSFWHP